MVPLDTVHASRHHSALGSWETVRASPHPALAHLVASYCGYDERTHAPLCRREVASETITIVIGFAPIRVWAPGRAYDAPDSAGAFVAGLHDGPVMVAHDGYQAGVQIDLTPPGAYTLLGLPLTEITGRVVHLDDVPTWPRALADRLAHASSWAERFAYLDDLLLRRFAEGPTPRPEVARSWRLLTDHAGRIEVADLARDTGWSRRHLGERFREQIGLPPKTVARVLRFQHALRLLTGPPRPWASIAIEAGYYDQAHFNRDFKALAGCPPRAYLDARLPAGGFES
jgi:AraC-like DNA-binding protein